jgi:hypothetical protein
MLAQLVLLCLAGLGTMNYGVITANKIDKRLFELSKG